MMSQPLQYMPGERHVYSNFGYNLLGRVIEKISQMSYYDFINKNVLLPLGINSIELAHTQLKDCTTDEAYYYPRKKGVYLTSIYDNQKKVIESYGSFCLEELDSAGGLIGTTEDVLTFAQDFNRLISEDLFKKISQKPNILKKNTTNWYYGLGWRITSTSGGTYNLWHRGFIDIGGASSFLVRASKRKDFSWIVSFNKAVSVSKIEIMMKNALEYV